VINYRELKDELFKPRNECTDTLSLRRLGGMTWQRISPKTLDTVDTLNLNTDKTVWPSSHSMGECDRFNWNEWHNCDRTASGQTVMDSKQRCVTRSSWLSAVSANRIKVNLNQYRHVIWHCNLYVTDRKIVQRPHTSVNSARMLAVKQRRAGENSTIQIPQRAREPSKIAN